MMRFEKNIADRKELVKRLGELTGIAPHYTKMPRCAYEIGAYTVERDGSLTVKDAADMEILAMLKEEGLIRDADGMIGAGTQPEDAEAVETEEIEETTAEAETVDAVETAETEPASQEPEETDLVPDSGYEFETQEEVAAQEEEPTPEDAPTALTVSLPMGEHTGVSLRNLVNMVYSRGPLLSKAAGGNFHVTKELVDALQGESNTATREAFLKNLADFRETHGSGMEGLEITEDAVSFTGFPAPERPEQAEAFCQLAEKMGSMALSQKRIQAKEVNDSNEKYAFRIWLIRLGMNGEAYKGARKVLMEHLSGHAAFRTPEEAEKAKEKNRAKREAQKAEQVEAEADARLVAEVNGLDEAQTAEAVADAAYIAAVNAAFEE